VTTAALLAALFLTACTETAPAAPASVDKDSAATALAYRAATSPARFDLREWMAAAAPILTTQGGNHKYEALSRRLAIELNEVAPWAHACATETRGEEWDGTLVGLEGALSIDTLSTNDYLLHVVCFTSAYNVGSTYVRVRNDRAELLWFPRLNEDGTLNDTLRAAPAGLDYREGYRLSIWNQWASQGQCGTYDTYALDASQPRLIERRMKEACGWTDRYPENWPIVYRAP